jgi:hypothetical protein
MLKRDRERLRMFHEPNPMPGIRAVLAAGFLSGNVFGVAYLVVSGRLIKIPLDLFVFLGFLGGFMGIGVIGMMTGALCGLTLRLVSERQNPSAGWRLPVLVAATASGLLGLWITIIVVNISMGG